MTVFGIRSIEKHRIQMIFKIKWLGILSILCCVRLAAAQPMLRLPSIIGDHMVLQADTAVTVWGWANPGSDVTVKAGWLEQAVTTKADYTTRWAVSVPTPAASDTSYEIEITNSRNARTVVRDVLIGQVWLCSGQSNMNRSAMSGIADMQEELEKPMPQEIRLFTVTAGCSVYPEEDCIGHWEVCDKNSARYFSAVGYFFGKRLYEELNHPIGLVNASWGGTPIEVWMPPRLFREYPEFRASWLQEHAPHNSRWPEGSLYNAMIAPLLRTAFAGVIWYQGESNKANARMYGRMFESMIVGWRQDFGRNLPFYFVQIAPYAKRPGMDAAIIREGQDSVARKVPGTGMVVISDLVDDVRDIHPRYKAGVGNRLAAYALSEVYAHPCGKYRTPICDAVSFRKGRAYVSFLHASGGLVCKGAAPLTLELCGADGVYFPAEGKIDRKNNLLVVWSESVHEPTGVRYSFSDDAIGNLFDATGLPVAPFNLNRL